MRLRGIAAVLGLAAFACACKSGPSATVRLDPNTRISAIIVYPFGFRWDEPAYRSFELSQRLIAAIDPRVGARVLLFGPPEFKVFRLEDDNPWAASTALPLLPAHSVRPDAAVVLRAWGEKRIVDGQKELMNTQGKRVGTTTVQQTTYFGRVEVLHPTTQAVIVEVTGEAPVDPFGEQAEETGDKSPELTALMERLAIEAVTALEPALTPPPSAQSNALPEDVSFAFIARAALEYADQGRPSIAEQKEQIDALELELLTQDRIRFANPGIQEDELSKLVRLPAGLYVRSAPAAWKLARGDVIIRIDNEPALPCRWQRVRLSPVPVSLKVRRATGEMAEVLFP